MGRLSVVSVSMGMILAIGLTACGAGREGEDLGVVTAEIELAPASVKCINVRAVNGSTTVNVPFNVSPGGVSSFVVSGLPFGNDTFTAQSYAVVCASIGTASATYVSDSVVKTVTSTPASVTLPMHLAGGGGTTTATIVFPDPHGAVTEFSIPVTEPLPLGLTVGPDGNIWYIELRGSQLVGAIGQFNIQSAQSVEYQLPPNPDGSLGLQDITTGPDGFLWFTESSVSKIGRVSLTGSVQEFPLAASGPLGITSGADGNVWFTEFGTGKIGRIVPLTGSISEFPTPSANSRPVKIIGGSDGNLWFTESAANKIGRITTAGVITEFTIPTASSSPQGIALGSDGNLWFTESSGGKIGRVTTAGAFTEFTVAGAGTVEMITAGPDGNLWFTGTQAVGRITTSGAITLFEFPGSNIGGTNGIIAGPDGNLWLTETRDGKIDRMTP
jgi:streptogramin lyase